MDRKPVLPKTLIGDQSIRTITVANIPPETTRDNIIIHFQKRKHGGGDVEAVWLTEDRIAHVTFANVETVEAVLGKIQLLNGSQLRVTRYFPSPQISDKDADYHHEITDTKTGVFEIVTAKMNQKLFHVDDPSTRYLMEKMKEELKIDLQATVHGILISGTLEEIQISHDFLQHSRHEASGCRFLSEEEDRPGSAKVETNSRKLQGDSDHPAGGEIKREAKTAQDSDFDYGRFQPSSFWCDPQRMDEDIAVLDAEEMLEPQQFETTPLSLKFLLQFNSQALQDINLKYKVNVVHSPDNTSVTLMPGKECDADKLNRACDAYLSCYQGACKGMISEEVILNLPYGRSLAHIDVRLPVLIENGIEAGRFVLYGDTASVMAAKQRLQEVSILEDSWEYVGDGMVYKHQNQETLKPEDAEPREIIKRRTSPVQTVSVWKGDITQLKVDAIVNPANSYLKHLAGLAYAITSAGGKRIQEESDSIVRSEGKVNVGSAVYTKAGRLPCEYVIHAVGPEWGMEDSTQCGQLLFDACLESLRIGKSLHVKSIAFPAISSGLFGVPLDVCAEAMLNAVEEHWETGGLGKNVLSDIRFVHIDDDAVDVFEKELLRRYPK